MAAQEVELIQREELYHNSLLPSGLTNKYLCYIADSTEGYFDKQNQLVLAIFPDNEKNTECQVTSLVLPNNKSQVFDIPCKLIIKLHSSIELLQEASFQEELIQIVFSQESFEVVELLLQQKIFSWSKFLLISIRYPHVLRYVLSETFIETNEILFHGLENGNTLLHMCVYANNSESMKLILGLFEHKSFQSQREITKETVHDFLNEKNLSENTALQLCTLKNSHECMLQLLTAGADVGIVDNNSNSIFHFAAYFDDVESVDIIFKYLESKAGAGLILRIEMKRLNRQLTPPVLLSNNTVIIEKYLQYVDLNEEFDGNGNLLIHLACKQNNTCLIESLCSLNADLNVVNRDALTPLKIAVVLGNVKVVELLVAAGVSVEGEDEDEPVIFLAAEMGHAKLVKTLIEYGASLYSRDSNVLIASAKGDHAELLEYLVTEQNMDVRTMDKLGESALFKSVRFGSRMCVKYLLVRGANCNQVNRDKENMLILAVEKGEVEIVKLLLEYKADSTFSRGDGKTALMVACINDRSDILSLMVDRIADEATHLRDKDGNNICHLALMNDAVKCSYVIFDTLYKEWDQDFTNIIAGIRNNDDLTGFQSILLSDDRCKKEFLSRAPVDYFLANPGELHRLYDEDNYDLLVIILDRFVKIEDHVTITTKYFDSISNGLYPGEKGFNYFRETLFHKILNCPHEELKYHPVVNLVAESKYLPYRFISYVELFCHTLLIFIFAFALISASYTCEADLFSYNDTLSILRLVCELLSLTFFGALAVAMFLHFISQWLRTYENKSNSHREELNELRLHDSKSNLMTGLLRSIESGIKGFWHFIDKRTFYFPSAVFVHFFGFYNSLYGVSLSTGIIFVILRFSQSEYQWAFASITFLVNSLNVLKYISVLPTLGAYIASILRIFVSDIPKFIVVVIVVLFSFIGSIHLAARFEAELRQVNDSVCLNESNIIFWFNPEETLTYTFKNPLFTGGIFALDGGPDSVQSSLMSLNIVFTAVYLFFAFLNIIVLLNILIAQLSQTYAEISAEREFYFIFQRVVQYELISIENLILGKYSRPHGVIDNIVVSKSKWNKYLDKSPSRSSDLLVRDIDARSKVVSEEVGLMENVVNKIKSGQDNSLDVLNLVYDRFMERANKNFSRELPRDTSSKAEVNLLNNRLDVLEGKMEKIIQLLENK